jgi:hypothetical protein
MLSTTLPIRLLVVTVVAVMQHYEVQPVGLHQQSGDYAKLLTRTPPTNTIYDIEHDEYGTEIWGHFCKLAQIA